MCTNVNGIKNSNNKNKAGNPHRKQYAMYVWTYGFDVDVNGCDETKFLAWDTHDKTCFTHTWNTPQKRMWLWNTCNRPGHEISTIFISDVHHNLQHAYDTQDCTTPAIATVRQMLTEGHSQVHDLKIYGLYAVSDIDVSEKNLVKYIVYYNDHCAGSDVERFDGVAVNNEAYSSIKCNDDATRITYLNNLQQIAVEAGKQRHRKLLTHYSMGWHWGRCENLTPSNITWNGVTQTANHHMIDIFDSTDVQVAYTLLSAIKERMVYAGYNHAEQRGKAIYATVYTNKDSPCQITFFPDTCNIGGHNETSMFDIFNNFHNGIEHAQPCIHYFRGVYSSGGHPDWPKHNTAPSPIVG